MLSSAEGKTGILVAYFSIEDFLVSFSGFLECYIRRYPDVSNYQQPISYSENAWVDGLAGAIMSSQESTKQEILDASLIITVA